MLCVTHFKERLALFDFENMSSTFQSLSSINKHCQRHNGPEGWVHITSSCTSLGQISISGSWLKNLNLQLQNFAWTLTSNLDQTFCSKSKQKFCFMTKSQLPNLQQTVANMILIINISNSNNWQPQQVLSGYLHTPVSNQSSWLNRSQSVS